MPEVLTAPIRVLRNAMQGNVHSRLEAAVSEIQRLTSELAAIQHEVAARRFATMRACAAKSQPPMSLAASLINSDPDEAWRKFASVHPHWLTLLRQACAGKLTIAEDRAREVETRVREELADEEFTEREIGQHPRLAKARQAAALWGSLRDQCNDPKDGQGTWRHVTKHLS